MARKKKFNYKNLKINEEELAVTKIGEMPNENKNPIFLLLVFGIFIVFVFFLPSVVTYFQEGNFTITGNSKVEDEPKENELESENEIVYYTIDSNLVVDLEEGIQLNNFKISTDSISYTVHNSLDNKFYFDKRNYFMELYTDNNTLLERIILSKESVSKDVSKDFNYSINTQTASEAKKIVFLEKNVEDYPNVELTKNEADEGELVCTKNFETITYTFHNDDLIQISDIVNYNQMANQSAYQNDLALWQSRVSNYNNIEGVSSSFVTSTNGFVANTVLDLENVKLSNVDNENYYEYKTAAKVVSFEMESRGFSCN